MSTQDTHTRWELEVASYIDTDELVVEVRLDGEDFGVVKATSSGPQLTVYNCSDRDGWTFPVEELIAVLGKAKTKLRAGGFE